MTDADQPTATVTWSDDERQFLMMVLEETPHDEIEIETAEQIYRGALGYEIEITQASDEMRDEPPTPADLLENFDGQQWTGTRADYEALQTALTMFVVKRAQSLTKEPDGDVVNGIHTTIQQAYEEIVGA